MTTEIILAIETSCDETAVAILQDGTKLLSNVVFSQMSVHQDFGGVMPEVASRIHVEEITKVITQSLKEANLTMDDMTAIGVTQGPGLIGSLHVGLQAAKTLAWYYELPLIGTHHIAGHIYSNQLVEPLNYPLLAIVVSGGHTELIMMRSENEFETIAQTGDDAIGEAYDKVARIMKAGYPGGPVIDKLAKEGQEHYVLPKIKPHTEDQFSFSGLKSSVMQLMAREEKAGREVNFNDLAYAFQERALEQIIDKANEVILETKPVHVVLAGGVAANSRLRKLVTEMVTQYKDIKLTIPPMKYCGDNAAMIAMAASINLSHHKVSTLDIGAKSSINIADF